MCGIRNKSGRRSFVLCRPKEEPPRSNVCLCRCSRSRDFGYYDLSLCRDSDRDSYSYHSRRSVKRYDDSWGSRSSRRQPYYKKTEQYDYERWGSSKDSPSRSSRASSRDWSSWSTTPTYGSDCSPLSRASRSSDEWVTSDERWPKKAALGGATILNRHERLPRNGYRGGFDTIERRPKHAIFR